MVSRITTFLLALCLGLPIAQAQSTKFEPTAQLDGQTLVLNGAGTRYRAVFKVYDMAVYTTKKVTTADALLTLPGPKRLSFVALRDIDGTQLGMSMITGMRANASPSQAVRYVNYTDRVMEIFSSERKILAGQTFRIDLSPSNGASFFIDGQPKGQTIKDPEFVEGVLRVWLGNSPADYRLKDALVGNTSNTSTGGSY